MKNIAYLLLSIAIVSTAPSALAQTSSRNSQRESITNSVNTLGTMNGGGSGVGINNNLSPNSPAVNQEPTRRPSYGDRGNIKYPSQGGSGNNND